MNKKEKIASTNCCEVYLEKSKNNEEEKGIFLKTSSGKRYRIAFDNSYNVFVGKSQQGSRVEIPDPDTLQGRLEYYPKW